jgi:hypothetical protein
MSTIIEHQESSLNLAPHEIRICVCITEPDLRSWVVEELVLITWPGSLTLETVDTLAELPAEARELVLIGIDGFSEDELAALERLDKHTPIVAIGSLDRRTAFAFACRLGPKLASHELRAVIRELVYRRAR